MTIERRVFSAELRMEGEEGSRRIVGYGATFNSMSEIILRSFREIIMPGAFSDVIERDDVRALINHDPSLILGRNRARTLRLVEDEMGLRYDIDPPDTGYARDLIVSLDRGDVNQSSFGFDVREEGEEWRAPDDDNPLPLRIIHKIARLYDVGPVTFPAYPTTSVSARALEQIEALAISGRATGVDADQIAVGRRDLRRRKLKLHQLRSE